MDDKLIWKSGMAKDYLKGLSDEDKQAELLDRGYDDEMLDGADLDTAIDSDRGMAVDDDNDLFDTVIPMINDQTLGGKFILVNIDDPNDIAMITDIETLQDDYDTIEIYDDGEGLYVVLDGANYNMYAIPEDEAAQQEFMEVVMPSFESTDTEDDDWDYPEAAPQIAEIVEYPEDYEDLIDPAALKEHGTRIVNNLDGESDFEEELLVEQGSLEFPQEDADEAERQAIAEIVEEYADELVNDNMGGVSWADVSQVKMMLQEVHDIIISDEELEDIILCDTTVPTVEIDGILVINPEELSEDQIRADWEDFDGEEPEEEWPDDAEAEDIGESLEGEPMMEKAPKKMSNTEKLMAYYGPKFGGTGLGEL